MADVKKNNYKTRSPRISASTCLRAATHRQARKTVTALEKRLQIDFIRNFSLHDAPEGSMVVDGGSMGVDGDRRGRLDYGTGIDILSFINISIPVPNH